MATDKVVVDIITNSDKSQKSILKYAAAATAAAAAVGLAIKVGKELVDAYAVQEQAEARLTATIKATGSAAGLTKDELLNMAGGLQKVTKFGDETIIGAESLLLTFKDIGEDTFPRALESILDVSEAMGTDLQASTVQIGKALNDPILGLTSLTRSGIQFTDKQKDVIKSMVETGDKAGAQNIILKELESQFGGVARAAADTATGGITQLDNIMGDLKESFGQSIAEGINPFVKGLTKVVTQMVEGRKKAHDLKEALNVVDQGGLATAEQTTLILQNQIDKLGMIANSYEMMNDEANTAYENAQRNLESYNEALTMGEDSFVTAERAKQAALKQTAIAEDENKKLSITAYEEIAQLKLDAMSADEKELLDLQNKINYWAELRGSVAGAEEAFQTYATLRNELQDSMNEGLTTEKENIDEIVTAQDFMYDNGIAALHDQSEAVEKLEMDYEALSGTMITTFTSAFKDVGAGNKTLMEGLKSGAKDAISSILEMYAQLWAARAVASLVSLDFIGAAGFTAAAAGAMVASGFVQSLATGGEFIADRATPFIAGEGAGSEKVTVEQVGSGGNDSGTMILNIDGQQFSGYLQNQINNRALRIPRSSLV